MYGDRRMQRGILQMLESWAEAAWKSTIDMERKTLREDGLISGRLTSATFGFIFVQR